MKALIFRAIALVLVTASVALAGSNFPSRADTTLTPGSFCQNPDSLRYPERIPYCSRDVQGDEKWAVIESYNHLGYHIDRSNRGQFKIDHLIPLCMGGSNEATNLWPQHQSIYQITDPLEGLACQRMAQGKLLQKRAVELIFRAKFHLEQADQVMQILLNL